MLKAPMRDLATSQTEPILKISILATHTPSPACVARLDGPASPTGSASSLQPLLQPLTIPSEQPFVALVPIQIGTVRHVEIFVFVSIPCKTLT